MLSAIKTTHNISLNSKTMTDLERSSLNEFEIQIYNTEQNGCFFHQTHTL